MDELREITGSFVVPPAAGVSIRTRLKDLADADVRLLRLVGEHLGRLAARDLARRIRDGMAHDKDAWAVRKRDLTIDSSARWAGSITRASNDQWGLARRAQAARVRSLRAGAATVSASEAGRVSVVRGGKRLLHQRHHLDEADVTEAEWRERWEAARWFCSATGESGKRYGNETIRVTPAGEVSIRLPSPLAYLANAPHGRYILSGRVCFAHRGGEWCDRVTANRAVAYRIHYAVEKGRWYLDASWQREPVPVVPLETLRAGQVIGVDTNADHLAAWRLDTHGNPTGEPRAFGYDLSGPASHRDAQMRHALTRLLHWVKQVGVKAVAVEDLDFTDSKSRELHGSRKRFRQVVSGMPTAKLRARLLSMCTEADIAVIAVDPAYTSRWGAQHWQAPTGRPARRTSRHEAAAIAIGRRALGYKIRRRATPPRPHQSDVTGHRTAQAEPSPAGRGETRHPGTGPPTRSVRPARAMYVGNQATQHRSGPPTEKDSHS